MNPKLILALLNNKNQNKGFTVFLATGIGLIMLLVGTTMLLKGQATRTNAAAQKETAYTGGITEAGLTRSLSKLNTSSYSPYLRKSYDPSPYIGNTAINEWNQAITNENADICKPTSTTIVNDLTTEVVVDEVVVDSATETKYIFKYKLLGYKYTPVSPTPTITDSNPVKIGDSQLLIQGTKNMENQTTKQNVTKQNVQVSLDVTLQNLPASFPGIYASNEINIGNGDVLKVTSGSDDANVICANCGATNADCTTLSSKSEADQQTYILKELMNAGTQAVIQGKAYLASLSMPPITAPTTECNLAAITDKSQLKNCKISIPKIDRNTTLPFPSHLSALPSTVQNQLNNTDTTYYFNYVVDNSKINNNSGAIVNNPKSNDTDDITSVNVTVDSSKGAIRLFIDKNITMSGTNGSFIHNGTTSAKFGLFGNPPDSIATNDQTWTINGSASTTYMFIYAPDASIQINGGAGDPDVIGSVWVKNFDNNGNNFELKVPNDFGSSLAQFYGVDYNLGIKVYKTSAPKSWERRSLN